MNLEITVVTDELLPGYNDESTLGPFEGVVSAAIENVDPALSAGSNITHWNRNNPAAASAIGCNNCVAIVDTDNFNMLYRKPISQVTTSGLKAAIESVLKLEFDPVSGNYISTEGEMVEFDNNKGLLNFFPGLGLFNLPINLPWWAYALLSAYTLQKANTSRTKAGKIVWGGIGVVAGANAYTRKP